MDNEISESIKYLNKRIDDNKTLIKTIITALTTIFAVVTFVFALNFNTEKEDLRNEKKLLKDEISDFLGKNTQIPDIKLYTKNENPLQGSTIKTKVEIDKEYNNSGKIEVPIILRNEGKGQGGDVTVKAYTKEEIVLWEDAAFEKQYKYESYWQGNTAIPNLPASNYAHPYPFTLYVKNAPEIELRIYPIKLKLYYGKDQTTSAEFNIEIEENLLKESIERP